MAKKPKADEASMDAPVRVKLDDTAVAERGRALAEKLGVVKTLRDQKKADAEKLQVEIDGILDEVEELRLEILEGEAEKRQGDLFAGDKVVGAPDPDLGHVGRVTDDSAKEILANVAKKAGEKAAGEGPFDFDGEEPSPEPVQVNREIANAKGGEKGAGA
jgi:hypothetical protein